MRWEVFLCCVGRDLCVRWGGVGIIGGCARFRGGAFFIVVDEMLTVLDSLPEGLLEKDATALHEVLDGPTLVHLAGEREPALFVSVLLHGNETTGWEAARRLLAAHRGRPLPRALSLFIGNVTAAREGLRHLSTQRDFNRVWRGGGGPEEELAARVLEEMRGRGIFASVDVHNNTGRNPHYACVACLDIPTLHLATLFGRLVVYFTQPDTVIARAFCELCPSVTVECGRPGQPHGVEHALEYLDACLRLEHFPEKAPSPADVDLFHSIAVVKIPEDVSFGFDGDADMRLLDDLDGLNFQELPEGTAICRVRSRSNARLEVFDERGEDVAAHFFVRRDEEIVTAVPVMPSMLTRDERVIRQDCLCYLMERYELPRL